MIYTFTTKVQLLMLHLSAHTYTNFSLVKQYVIWRVDRCVRASVIPKK
jgi:hypothetical protein